MQNLPRIDYERKVFVTRGGVELHLQPISALILERLHSDKTGKPVVPKVTVTIAGKYERFEDNPEDPDYVAAMRQWSRDHNSNIVKYIFVHGITDSPPPEFIEEHAEYFPNATERDLKYLWVGSMVDEDSGDIPMLVEAITGQNSVTEAGLEEATASFPGDNGREGDRVVSVRETAGIDND